MRIAASRASSENNQDTEHQIECGLNLHFKNSKIATTRGKALKCRAIQADRKQMEVKCRLEAKGKKALARGSKIYC
jgi:hypothetical protein